MRHWISIRGSVCPSIGPSIGPSVGPSVRNTLLCFGFWPHCSCPNYLVTSITAPANPHSTGVAEYPALFKLRSSWTNWWLRSQQEKKIFSFQDALFMYRTINEEEKKSKNGLNLIMITWLFEFWLLDQEVSFHTDAPKSLVACYVTLHPALSVRPFLCLSVCLSVVHPSVRPSHLVFFFLFFWFL